MKIRITCLVVFITISLSAVQTVVAQANLPLYTDNLVNAFQNWSWATVNFSNTNNGANPSSVHSGGYSIRVSDGANFQALSTAISVQPQHDTLFQPHFLDQRGGASGGQQRNVYGTLANAAHRLPFR